MILNSSFIADEKSALLFVVELEEEKVHVSWKIGEEIISLERIPVNYPGTTLAVWKNKKNYLKAIESVSWINEENIIVKDDQFDFGNALNDNDKWGRFAQKYKPVKNHLNNSAPYDECMYETYGDEYKYIESISVNPNTSNKIWTICEEDGITFIQAGWHFVNRLGYVISEVPFTDKDEQFTI